MMIILNPLHIDSTSNVLIYVGAGGPDAPYYSFLDESKEEVISDFRINTSETCTFKRLDEQVPILSTSLILSQKNDGFRLVLSGDEFL